MFHFISQSLNYFERRGDSLKNAFPFEGCNQRKCPRIKSAGRRGGETLAIEIRNAEMARIGLKKRGQEGTRDARDSRRQVGKALNLGNFNGFKVSEGGSWQCSFCDFAHGHPWSDTERAYAINLFIHLSERLPHRVYRLSQVCGSWKFPKFASTPIPKFVQRHRISSGLCSFRYTAKCFGGN